LTVMKDEGQVVGSSKELVAREGRRGCAGSRVSNPDKGMEKRDIAGVFTRVGLTIRKRLPELLWKGWWTSRPKRETTRELLRETIQWGACLKKLAHEGERTKEPQKGGGPSGKVESGCTPLKKQKFQQEGTIKGAERG